MNVVVRKASYRYETLRPAFFEMMDAIGGRAIGKGCRVLIKPNMLSPATPADAVLTHPLIIKAAAEYVLQRGGHPWVSDSPALGSFDRILKDNGTTDALRDLDVPCRPFSESVKADIGEPFSEIDLAADAVHADAIINLPKLKTHSQMLLTLGVKNMFGCVVGYRKAEWHMRTGINREMFAKLLVLIYQRTRPAFTILDGILAMEGEGPGKGGVPRKIGVMIGSDNALGVDAAVCRMLGLDPESLPTLKAAADMGLLDSILEIDGKLPEIHDFRFPDMALPMFGPRQAHGFIRRHLLQRPVADETLCKMCSDCWTMCPAKAITPLEKPLRFNYDRCIRCYCCIEVCPHGALHTEETLPGKIIRSIIMKNF